MIDPVDPAEALQIGFVAALLASPNVAAIVAGTPDGPAVFAPGQPFYDAYPRVTLDVPQVVGDENTCSQVSECFVTAHSWARGPDCTLVAARLAGAVRRAANVILTLESHQVVTHRFDSATAVGDDAEAIEHVVSVFRYQTLPAG